MKTPITYYGGKISMINDILPLIPKHTIYVEPFVGGGAIFWSKSPSKVEVLNDYNDMVVNFYRVLKHDFKKLRTYIKETTYARMTYKYALSIYHVPHLYTPIQRAWAFWVLTSQGFSSQIGSWSYGLIPKKTKAFYNKKLTFGEELANRIENVQIECNDALKVIASRDTADTFNYIDPPYVGANQGHYGGYTEIHFEALLQVLSNIKGKFLLSSYDSPLLEQYTTQNNWHTKRFIKSVVANKTKGKRGKKVEVLTANYELPNDSNENENTA